jgi:UDP-N-acetylglucosamine acyltransferase
MHYKGEPTELVIGDNNTIREYCSLNKGTAEGGGVTRIGNDNFIMAYVHVAHDCVMGSNNIFANGSSLAGHVNVGDFVVMGGFTLIHQFCRIGSHCITGVGTVSFKDIPPYIVAAGNTAIPHGINVKGLRRRDFDEATIEAIRRAYKTVYRKGLLVEAALTELAEAAGSSREIGEFAEFIRNSKRGIIR